MSPAQIIQLIGLLLPLLDALLSALHQHPDTTPDVRALVPALSSQHAELVALTERVRDVQGA